MGGNWSVRKVSCGPRTQFIVYRLLRIAGFIALGLAVICICLILAYRFVNPPLSTLMAGHALTGTEVRNTWVPLEHISPHLVRSVVMSEDAQFCQHWGGDLEAIREAIERSRNGGGPIRGASTIWMQAAKHRFLN